MGNNHASGHVCPEKHHKQEDALQFNFKALSQICLMENETLDGKSKHQNCTSLGFQLKPPKTVISVTFKNNSKSLCEMCNVTF